MKGELTFFVLLLFIVGVSAYDTYLTIEFRQSILTFEENPVGRWLTETGGVPTFVISKVIGTSAVVMILLQFHFAQHRLTSNIIGAIAFVQAALLFLRCPY